MASQHLLYIRGDRVFIPFTFVRFDLREQHISRFPILLFGDTLCFASTIALFGLLCTLHLLDRSSCMMYATIMRYPCLPPTTSEFRNVFDSCQQHLQAV